MPCCPARPDARLRGVLILIYQYIQERGARGAWRWTVPRHMMIQKRWLRVRTQERLFLRVRPSASRAHIFLTIFYARGFCLPLEEKEKDSRIATAVPLLQRVHLGWWAALSPVVDFRRSSHGVQPMGLHEGVLRKIGVACTYRQYLSR